MRELRRIMEQQKSLPVLYNTTYDDFAKLLKEQGEADAEMLQQLRRTTMVQHLSPGEPVLFRQNVCFAVLRRLATVCCPLVGRTPGDVFFVERVRDAVKHICSDDYFMELRVKDKREAKEWLQSLNVQLKRIEEVGGLPACFQCSLASQCARFARHLSFAYRLNVTYLCCCRRPRHLARSPLRSASQTAIKTPMRWERSTVNRASPVT